jgi:predicted ATPase
LARRQSALAWELRAATGLAQLRFSQHRFDEALDVLAPVYNRFTEGFESSDLMAARELLERLTGPFSDGRQRNIARQISPSNKLSVLIPAARGHA